MAMVSSEEALANLLKVGQLKAEPPDKTEFDGLVSAAARLLSDASIPQLSLDGRFLLAYDAAHSFALAALRMKGYRSEKRYLVFQVLEHTLSIPANKWRLLAKCHTDRNLALYEGAFSTDEQLLHELILIAKELQAAIVALG
jgi:hypothetical protein